MHAWMHAFMHSWMHGGMDACIHACMAARRHRAGEHNWLWLWLEPIRDSTQSQSVWGRDEESLSLDRIIGASWHGGGIPP